MDKRSTDIHTGDVASQGRLPPVAPGRLPVLGHLLAMKRDKLGFLERCAREIGDVVRLDFGPRWPVVLLSDPDAIETLLADRTGTLRKSRYFWRHTDALLGNGLILSGGKLWARQRRLMTPAFSAKRVGGYVPAMVSAAEDLGSSWVSGEVREIHHDMIELSLRIAMKTLFDLDDPAAVEKIGRENESINAEFSRRVTRPFLIPDAVPLPGHLAYRRGVAYLDGYIAGLIAERRRDPGDRGDFFSQLMDGTDEDGAPMSDRQLRDEAINILAAGHETSAVVLSWALHLLAGHPDVQEAVHDEISSVLGGADPTSANMRSLVLLEQVVTETMRLFPPIWFMSRFSTTDMTAGGYAIPAETSIYISPWTIHRDPRYYADPSDFRPDRWTKEFARSIPRCAYMPFSTGPRMCIGRSFAMLEAVSVLAVLLRAYRFEAAGSTDRLDPSIALRPLDPATMKVVRR